jgi:hypothetical protein
MHLQNYGWGTNSKQWKVSQILSTNTQTKSFMQGKSKFKATVDINKAKKFKEFHSHI